MWPSDKTWKPEAVLLLGAGMLFSLSLGGLLTLAASHLLPGLSPVDDRFVQFLLGTASLQGAALILIHFFLRFHDATWREFLGLHRPGLLRIAGRALITVALITPLVLVLADWCAWVITKLRGEVELQSAVKVMEIAVSPWRRALFTFASIVLAPVAEEMLFRGVLYTTIKQEGYPRMALVVSSILFSAIHLNLLAFVPFVLLAIVLTLLYERTGCLLAPILAHAGFNAVNIVYYALRNPPAG